MGRSGQRQQGLTFVLPGSMCSCNPGPERSSAGAGQGAGSRRRGRRRGAGGPGHDTLLGMRHTMPTVRAPWAMQGNPNTPRTCSSKLWPRQIMISRHVDALAHALAACCCRRAQDELGGMGLVGALALALPRLLQLHDGAAVACDALHALSNLCLGNAANAWRLAEAGGWAMVKAGAQRVNPLSPLAHSKCTARARALVRTCCQRTLCASLSAAPSSLRNCCSIPAALPMASQGLPEAQQHCLQLLCEMACLEAAELGQVLEVLAMACTSLQQRRQAMLAPPHLAGATTPAAAEVPAWCLARVAREALLAPRRLASEQWLVLGRQHLWPLLCCQVLGLVLEELQACTAQVRASEAEAECAEALAVARLSLQPAGQASNPTGGPCHAVDSLHQKEASLMC